MKWCCKRIATTAALVVATACGAVQPAVTTSPSAGTPSPSQSATATPSLAPVRSLVLAAVTGPGNAVRLVGSDGAPIATATADPTPFRPNTAMSWTSTSLTRLYFLNGGSEVRFLEPNGATGLATRIQLGADQQAAFAVSPDDQRIAVSIFSYKPSPNAQGVNSFSYTGMRLYVEDLKGGGHHVDVFNSATVAEYPIGWTRGKLIIAVTSPTCCQGLVINPYGATAYHVVDPDTGERLLALCEGGIGPAGPIETFGVMCITGFDGPQFLSWDGLQLPKPAAVPNPSRYLSAASPDEQRVAVGQSTIWIWGPNGASQRLQETGYVYGWLDKDTFIFRREGASSLSAYQLSFGTDAELPDATSYLGTLPAAVS
jgi:hypothetical protein